jgi:tRNA(Ile)-lysidine synthase
VHAAGTDELLGRCTFPPAATPVTCALSGGADSTALVALAVAAGCVVTAVHVDHGLREHSRHDGDVAQATADHLGVAFRRIRVDVAEGANLEARARTARRRALGPDALFGHTADDQAETLLLALLRGSGTTGLGAIGPGWRHPILALRRAETHALCRELDLAVATDPSNDDPRFRRNRIRHELLPLLDDIAERDVTTLLARTADLVRADDQFLDELAAAIDPTDAAALAAAPRPLASRAVRQWLDLHGYPPDSAAVARVIAVARGDLSACELSGGRRIERQGDLLVLFPPTATNR